MQYIIIAIVSLSLFSCLENKTDKPNFSVSNNADWSFELGDNNNAKTSNFDDEDWRVLDIPHDWSTEKRSTPLAAPTAWYRKTIKVPASWKGKQVEIAFDGVYMESTVYANGAKLGKHPYGWMPFAYDITDIVNKEKSITLAVHVNNEQQASAQEPMGSGIYAPSRFIIKEAINIPRHGVVVNTSGGQVNAEIKLCNKTGKTQDIDIALEIVDANNKIVASLAQGLTLKQEDVINAQLEVENPLFWDIDTPHLYHFVSTLSQNGKILHQEKIRFGFRDIEWQTDSSIKLNGRRIELHAVCKRHNGGALGAAVPEKVNRMRIQQLKDMGCNAIYLAHAVQAHHFYRLCDELGMLVINSFLDKDEYKTSHKKNTNNHNEHWKTKQSEWVKHNSKHPCVAMCRIDTGNVGAVADASNHPLYPVFMDSVVDYANFEKDLYYHYQSLWTNEPMIHIVRHWTHPEIKKGTTMPVKVYTNGDEAELFLNEKSVGKQKLGKGENQIQWLVENVPGTLKAIAYTNQEPTAKETVNTSYAPRQISLSVNGEPLAKAGKDMVQVRITSLDNSGNICPNAQNRHYYYVLGDGAIKALDNGNEINTEIHYDTHSHIGHNGLMRAYIVSGKKSKPIALVVASILGDKKLQSSNRVSIDIKQLNLRGNIQGTEIEIYYTTDGTTPNGRSQQYRGSFAISQGTTVKAVVYINGKEALQMEEGFGVVEE